MAAAATDATPADADEPHLDGALVRRLLIGQFPHWADLPIWPVASPGWCHRMFHLGEQMVVRLPRHRAYAEQVEKEYQWLTRLAPLLPLPIPEALAIGEPAQGFPFRWAIYRWIQGESAIPENVPDLTGFASEVGRFLAALHRIESISGPPPGPHNSYRGGALSTYDAQTRQAIAILDGKIDAAAVAEVWDVALACDWADLPVWIHGDVGVGNLLVRNGRLCAVIDFGNLAVGDPACDLAIAWNIFEDKSREAFRSQLPLDAGTWARGRGWALWKALIVAAGLTKSNSFEALQPWRIIDEVLDDHRRAAA